MSPSLQQMGSERVPEGVRTDDLLDAGQFRVITIDLTLEAGEHNISVCGLTKTIVVE